MKTISTVKDADVMEIDGMTVWSAVAFSRCKYESPFELGIDAEADQQCQGISVSREEKVSSLKAVRIFLL